MPGEFDYYHQMAPGQLVPFRPMSWWEDAVGYEVHIRSFADSDGDGCCNDHVRLL